MALFRPSINYGAPLSSRVSSRVCFRGMKYVLKIYCLSKTDAAEQAAVKAFHLYLIMCGTSDSVVDKEWENYVATLACACLPSIKPGLLGQPASYEEITLSTADVKALTEWYEQCWESSNLARLNTQGYDERPPQSLRAPHGLTFQLPQGAGAFQGDMEDLMALPSLYGHFSLVIFLADKKDLEHGARGLTHERGVAIEQKYFNGKQIASLTGTLALSDAAHRSIPVVYVSPAALRKLIFKKVASFDQHSSDVCSEVIATTTRLMRYSGMQHVPLIDRYLSRYKYADAITMLRVDLLEYRASKRDMKTIPDEQVPYFKLIFGNDSYPFLRKNLTNLVAVAVTDAREEKPDLRYRWVPANYDRIMERYNQETADFQRPVPQR